MGVIAASLFSQEEIKEMGDDVFRNVVNGINFGLASARGPEAGAKYAEQFAKVRQDLIESRRG